MVACFGHSQALIKLCHHAPHHYLPCALVDSESICSGKHQVIRDLFNQARGEVDVAGKDSLSGSHPPFLRIQNHHIDSFSDNNSRYVHGNRIDH
jgi:hypothetical protein